MKESITFWKMNLLHDGNSSFDFCKGKNIIGFGWCLKETQAHTFEDYIALSEKEKFFSTDGKINYDLRCAVNAFCRMKKDDIVLINDSKGQYYLCKVDDNVKNINQGSEFVSNDATCNRNVTFLDVVILKADMKALGVPYQAYTPRHTIEKFNLNNSNSKKVVDFLKSKI